MSSVHHEEPDPAVRSMQRKALEQQSCFRGALFGVYADFHYVNLQRVNRLLRVDHLIVCWQMVYYLGST